jgi:hypothetical protein
VIFGSLLLFVYPCCALSSFVLISIRTFSRSEVGTATDILRCKRGHQVVVELKDLML